MVGKVRKVWLPLAAVALVAGLAACEPPDRLELVVDTTAVGADDVPGDGLCSSAAAGGACTLEAALAEGATAPAGAVVDLPAGTYGGFDPTVTGDVVVQGAGSTETLLADLTLVVAPGARFEVFDVGTTTEADDAVTLRTEGVLRIHRANLGGIGSTVRVSPGGSAVVHDSIVVGFPNAVYNEGTLLSVRSTLSGLSRWSAALVTLEGAESHLQATGVHSLGGYPYHGGCIGPAPVSHGYVWTQSTLLQGCTLVASPTDGHGDPMWSGMAPLPESPLVDAIPLDDPACHPDGVDVFGNPRGVDGDGDGIGGCDIGAVELQP